MLSNARFKPKVTLLHLWCQWHQWPFQSPYWPWINKHLPIAHDQEWMQISPWSSCNSIPNHPTLDLLQSNTGRLFVLYWLVYVWHYFSVIFLPLMEYFELYQGRLEGILHIVCILNQLRPVILGGAWKIKMLPKHRHTNVSCEWSHHSTGVWVCVCV